MAGVSGNVGEAIAAQYARERPLGPKYLRLRDAVIGVIEAGVLRAGDALPPEQELTAAVPLSLGTVQKALGSLAEDGILVRRQGHGTFVAVPQVMLVDPWHFRFLADDNATLLPVFARIVGRHLVRESGPWADALGEDGVGYVRITRLIEVNREFTCFNQVYLSATTFGAFLKLPMSALQGTNFKHVLRERFNTVTHHLTQRMRCGVFPLDACKALGVSKRTTGMTLEIVGLSYRNAPIYYQNVLIPPAQRWLEISAGPDELAMRRSRKERGPQALRAIAGR